MDDHPAETAVAEKRSSLFVELLKRLLREKPLGTFGGIIILTFMLVSLLAPTLAPFPYTEIHLIDRLQGSSSTYLLGTDQLGRDFMSRLIYGARHSALVSFSATTLSLLVSLLLGGVAGFVGGKFDLGVQRFVDAWMSFPGLLLLLTVMSIVGQGVLQIIVVLGISYGIGNSRIVRSAVIGIKGNDYFLAAKALGTPLNQILFRHVLPNIMPPLIIIFSINIGSVIMSEAALSFLGFGLPPEVPSWGGMLSREGRQYMEMAPRLALWPGLCLVSVVYGVNMFGDAMRDLLDPRMRGGEGSYGTAVVKRKRGFFSRLLNPVA